MEKDSSSQPQRLPEFPPDILELQKILDSTEPYVSLGQVSSLLGAKYNTAVHWVRDGKLKAVKVGGRYRVYMEPFRDFLKTQGYWDLLEQAQAITAAKAGEV